MLDKKDCINYAQEFVNRIIAKGIDIQFASIFGSYAKNKQTEDSDIDILLVGEKFTGVGFIDNLLFAKELFEFDSVQVKTYSLEDYLDGDPLIEEINRSSYNLNVN